MDSSKDQPHLDRTLFIASRLLEFFTQKELTMQIGQPLWLWALAILKELIDNALDAAESVVRDLYQAPVVRVTIERDILIVEDNGPGIPEETVRHALDYAVRASDKAYYVSPTRGALGNALKCVFAAPVVIDGKHGHVEVEAQGVHHDIRISLDSLDGRPDIKHTPTKTTVKNGTLVKMHWPDVASSLAGEEIPKSYNDDGAGEITDCLTAAELLWAFSVFNPHASFHLTSPSGPINRVAANPAWQKWQPNQPTCPYWYTPETLRNQIAAYLTAERLGGRAKTVRELVTEFNGLRGTQKSKEVLAQANLTGAKLGDLVKDENVDAGAVQALLRAMQGAVRPVKSKALGFLGQEHLTDCLERYGADLAKIRYRRLALPEGMDGLPFVLETALGVRTNTDIGRELLVGLNWSPAIRSPFDELPEMLSDMWVEDDDPVIVFAHLACPQLGFTDRGKARLTLTGDFEEALKRSIKYVAAPWEQYKRRAARQGRQDAADLEQLYRGGRKAEAALIKRAAYQVMEEAYLYMSDGGRWPAQARQVMYANRERMLPLTGGKCWKKSSYFTQTLLPDFMAEHPELTRSWDIVFDSRGHLLEPHTSRSIDLGTLEVRKYIGDWTDDKITTGLSVPRLRYLVPTVGPIHRYRFVLFIEKEGFFALLDRADIANRFDIAIMSTKGMSVTAARALVERLSERGVTILVLRDFDKAGFSIVHTLRSDTRRYHFKTPPRVIDLGLKLEDVEALGLASEYVEYPSNKDPKINLRECGATEEECAFLVRGQKDKGKGWWGHRTELNTMTSPQFLGLLESKFDEHGVTKVVPGAKTLQAAYRRAARIAMAQKEIDKMLKNPPKFSGPIPDNLQQCIHDMIEGQNISWDEAVWRLASAGLIEK
jgi:DNA topoisomerase VI subunit B